MSSGILLGLFSLARRLLNGQTDVIQRGRNFFELGHAFQLLNCLVTGEAYEELFLSQVETVFFDVEEGSKDVGDAFLGISKWSPTYKMPEINILRISVFLVNAIFGRFKFIPITGEWNRILAF